jgi:hypothetical protein
MVGKQVPLLEATLLLFGQFAKHLDQMLDLCLAAHDTEFLDGLL